MDVNGLFVPNNLIVCILVDLWWTNIKANGLFSMINFVLGGTYYD